MKDSTKIKIAWALKEPLANLDPKLKDVILEEIFSIVDKRIKYLEKNQTSIFNVLETSNQRSN